MNDFLHVGYRRVYGRGQILCILQLSVRHQGAAAIFVKGGIGVVSVAAGQDQKGVLQPPAQVLDVQAKARFYHAGSAEAGHLLPGRLKHLPVPGHKILHGGHPGLPGAQHGDDQLVLRYLAALRPAIGQDGHGVGVHAPLEPRLRPGAPGVHNGVQPLIFGHVHQV